MKTFDDAMKVIELEIKDIDKWHRNHCRCAEIDASPFLDIYFVSLARTLCLGFVQTKVIDATLIKELMMMSFELGVSVGQEMEKLDV